jgi:hypothetical protein
VNALSIISQVGEVLAWAGITGGVVCLVAWMFIRAYDGGWEPTDAVVIDEGDGSIARWFAGPDLHQRRLDEHEREHTGAGDVVVYYARNDPSRMRVEPGRPAARVLLVLGWTLSAVGVTGLVASVVAPLLEAA